MPLTVFDIKVSPVPAASASRRQSSLVAGTRAARTKHGSPPSARPPRNWSRKTHHEERKVIDASPAAITLGMLMTDEELDSLEKRAGDGEEVLESAS